MQMRVVTDGLVFPEGPLELPGGDLLVTEMRAGLITRVRPDGTKSLFCEIGRGPNGLALGPGGDVFVAQNGGPVTEPTYRGGSLDRISADGAVVTTLYERCGSNPLNAPNDLVFDADGGCYFTDLGKTRGRARDLGAVYYARPDGSSITEIAFPMEGPNGCALSPDQKTLYVAETFSARLWALRLDGPGQVVDRTVLATIPGTPTHSHVKVDSMCVDEEGNILVGTLYHGGITIVAPDGAILGHEPTGDELTTNACFGGPEMRTLYVTLSVSGRLVAFDSWPTRGLKLSF
jgi:gluconolactonase